MDKPKRVSRIPVSLRLSEREREFAIKASSSLGMNFAEFCRHAITQQAIAVINQEKSNAV